MTNREGSPTAVSWWMERPSVRRILTGIAAVLLVMFYGVIGYVIQGWSPFDALYMVVITISGVGFEEVHPLESTMLRIHTMTLIVAGIFAVGYTVAGFIGFVTEGEIQKHLGHQRMRRHMETLNGHAIIAGFGRVGTLVCEELVGSERPFVIIEKSSDRIPEIERRGFLFVQGDATSEKTLMAAGLARAGTLVAVMPKDADNVFVTLTARQIAPKVEIIARAEMPTTFKTLRQAGADHVVLPAAIGAHRIASLLTNPSAVQFAELVTHHTNLAIEMEEFPLNHESPLLGLTLRQSDIRRKTGVIVVAIKRIDGRVEFPAEGEQPFAAGDSIVVLGRRSNLEDFEKSFRT